MIASRTGIVAIVALASGMALGAAVQRALRAPALVPVIVTAAPVTFTRARPPEPPPPPPPAHVGCTVPVSEIGLVATKYLETTAPDGLLGVAASPVGCTLAIWNRNGVYVSRDDGANWRHEVALPMLAHDVAIDRDETVYALHGAELVRARRDGSVTTAALPGAGFDRIATSGTWVVVASPTELALSHDAGATWSRHGLPCELTSAAIFVDDAGALRLAAGTTMNDPITYFIAEGAGWRTVWTSPPHHVYVDPTDATRREMWSSSIDTFAFANDGTLVAENDDAWGTHLYQVAPTGAVTTPAHLTVAVAGAPVANTRVVGMTTDWSTYDAHGDAVSILEGRGPIRTTEQVDHLTHRIWENAGTGRWLVGALVP